MTLLKTPEEKRAYNNQYYAANAKAVQAQRRARKNSTIRGRMLSLKVNAVSRAREMGWSCDLTLDFLCALWEEQGGLCALTGKTLSLEKEKQRWGGILVSLDRIDSSKGYTQDNVWLTTTAVNYAKGVQSLEDFVEMCKTVVEKFNA